MRWITPFLVALLLVACSTMMPPVSLSEPTPATASTEQTMDCVNRELKDMAYEVTSSDPQTGHVVAVHVNEEPWYLRWIGLRPTADQLTVSTTGNSLQVAAISSGASSAEQSASTQLVTGTGTSRDAARDAQRLLDSCAKGRT
jgi:hypothetical protein